MMLIDMTPSLWTLLLALDMVLVIAATAIAVSVWRHQRASARSRDAQTTSTLAVVGSSPSAPYPNQGAPSDTSVSEAA